MADISSKITLPIPVNAFGRVIVETDSDANSGDTIILKLSDLGFSNIIGVIGFVHTQRRSIVVREDPMTSVTARNLTITVGGSGVTRKQRNYIVFGF